MPFIGWLAAIGVVGQGKESWPASADRRGFASRNLNPPIPPPRIFPSASEFSERPRGKMLTMSLSPDTRAARKKNWRGDQSKAQHALPDDGKRAQTNKEVRSHVS